MNKLYKLLVTYCDIIVIEKIKNFINFKFDGQIELDNKYLEQNLGYIIRVEDHVGCKDINC
jgi:hypothetical protein